MQHRSRAFLSAALLVSAAPFAAADVLFSQPKTADDTLVGRGWYSHSEPRVDHSFKHADDFTLSAASTIDRVTWWGMSDNDVHADLTNFTAFTIEVYGSRTTVTGLLKPTSVLASWTFGIEETDATATGRVSVDGEIEYRHEVSLGDGVALEGGVDYFLAISVTETDKSGDAWKWQDADLFDGWSASYSHSRSRWDAFEDTDSAFELSGVPAPPGAVGIILGVGFTQRRKRSRDIALR